MKRALWVLTLVATIFVAASITFNLLAERQRILAEAAEQAESLRGALVEYTDQTFTALNLALLGLEAPLMAAPPEGTTQSLARHEILRDRQEASSGTYAYFMLDAEGRLVASSRTADPELSDLSDTMEFTTLREDPDLGVVVGSPRLGRVGFAEGQELINIARALQNSDGSFAGVVAVSLSLQHLHAYYDKLLLGPNATAGLVREDGILILRSPFAPQHLGEDISGGELLRRVQEAPEGLYTARALLDGEMRISSYARLPNFPMIAYIGVAERDRLAGWVVRAVIEAALGVLVIALIVILAIGVDRSVRRREAAQLARSELFRELATASASIVQSPTLEDVFARLERSACAITGARQARTVVGEGADVPAGRLPDGRMLARLVDAQGHPVGRVEISEKAEGRFSDDDRFALVQLADVASTVVSRLQTSVERDAALRAAEAASASEHEARMEIETIFASITDAVFAIDPDWQIIYVNDNAEKLARRSAADLVGHNAWEAFHTLRDTELHDRLVEAMVLKTPALFDFAVPDVRLWLSVRAFPHERGITAYLRDITEAKETEAMLRQAQRMEAVGQLTGGVAHDFNNLLTVIIGNADEIISNPAGAAEDSSPAELILKAAERAAELTQRLLAFSRRQALDPRAVDANQLVAHLQDLIQRTLGEAIAMEFVLGAGLWRATVDPGQLENAILNLAINAQHAMAGGGHLTIETANVVLDADYASQRMEVEPGEYVMISVTDTGAGMSRQTIDRAFEPFFTTKPAGIGTGLGLSMIYGFIKQSRGHIAIYSEIGQGTSVRLYLPRATDDLPVAELGYDAESVTGGTERILVVEDDELVRRHTVSTLTTLGYRVTAVEDGQKAIERLLEEGGYDLLLADVVLAGPMNGRQVADIALARQPGLKVLFMSGYTENAIVHHGRLDRGVNLLSKPFRRGDLARKLRAILDD
ncbi:response regulator [Arsenicitalea aurantiaca]|uniref:histidine kinase n=1 Tax=Arsenicitalea aurantiaca TaxID=1783274 RepID=A0A433XB76_9HYPH|nr:ATP-binding protein [Arsenicitalea aurantiaca]RUT31351.1 response regulator [Arsenicitalea aurantiaca]